MFHVNLEGCSRSLEKKTGRCFFWRILPHGGRFSWEVVPLIQGRILQESSLPKFAKGETSYPPLLAHLARIIFGYSFFCFLFSSHLFDFVIPHFLLLIYPINLVHQDNLQHYSSQIQKLSNCQQRFTWSSTGCFLKMLFLHTIHLGKLSWYHTQPKTKQGYLSP